jgi:hypothetical protein
MVDIQDRLRWQSVIALITLVVRDIGRVTHITSGSLDIGFIGMGRKCGVAATTLCGDIDQATKERRLPVAVGDLPRSRGYGGLREVAFP